MCPPGSRLVQVVVNKARDLKLAYDEFSVREGSLLHAQKGVVMGLWSFHFKRVSCFGFRAKDPWVDRGAFMI